MNFLFRNCLLLFAATSVTAFADQQPPTLYQTDDIHTKYVMYRHYSDADNNVVSEVVIASAISVTSGDEQCLMVMTNAYLLRTITSNNGKDELTNRIEQKIAHINVLRMDFSTSQKIIYHNALLPMAQLKLGEPKEPTVQTYKGKASINELKKMGLPLPDQDRPESPSNINRDSAGR